MKGALLFTLAFAPPGDSWFGRDKVKHFFVSAFAQSVTYAALQSAGADRTTALIGATATTATLGVGKEFVDRRRGGQASGRDMFWNVAGTGAATLVLVRTAR